MTAYKLYYTPKSDDPFSYDDPNVDLGIPPTRPVGTPPITQHVVNLDAIPELAALPEGEYDLGITAIDDVGNESDFTEASAVPLDLEPPAAPASVSVITNG